jgi:hypothetical protein
MLLCASRLLSSGLAFGVLTLVGSSFVTACAPEPATVDDPLRINGTTCITGTLNAAFPDLIVGVPVDRPVRVQDAGGASVDVEVALAEGSDPAFSLLRSPFVADDATIVPLRVQLIAAGTVIGNLVVTPASGSPCTIDLTASDGPL